MIPREGRFERLGQGVIILDNYMMNMITCSKTLQIRVQNGMLNAYDFKYVDISKGKNTNVLKTESV